MNWFAFCWYLVRKYREIVLGWWRISHSPVLPCVSRRVWRPTDKFGSNKRTVCRLLTCLVAAEKSVLVASKIRWANQRVYSVFSGN